jgi:hypothetical protein
MGKEVFMSVYFKICEDLVKVIPSYDAERAIFISYEPKMIVINVSVPPKDIRRRVYRALIEYYKGKVNRPVTYKERQHFKQQLDNHRGVK